MSRLVRTLLSTTAMLRTSFLVALAFSMISCHSIWQEPVSSGEIIYESDAYPSHLLGFVMANGEGNLLLDLGGRNFDKPVWSDDGRHLYGLSGGSLPHHGFPAYWSLENGRFKICKRNLPYFGQIHGAGNAENPAEVFVQNTSEIITFDISTCKRLNTWVDYSDRKEQTNEIAGFSYSPSRNSLVYGLVKTDRQTYEKTHQLIELDLNTGKTTRLAEGIYPAWSPDGSQLAYISLDGLYILSTDPVGVEPVHLAPQPSIYLRDNSWGFSTTLSWSPDRLWLAYHRCGEGGHCQSKDASIYKISSQGGPEERILKGGVFPSWRP
jgi:hypothetical protein